MKRSSSLLVVEYYKWRQLEHCIYGANRAGNEFSSSAKSWLKRKMNHVASIIFIIFLMVTLDEIKKLIESEIRPLKAKIAKYKKELAKI